MYSSFSYVLVVVVVDVDIDIDDYVVVVGSLSPTYNFALADTPALSVAVVLDNLKYEP